MTSPLPHPSRLNPGRHNFAEIMQRHDEAVARGESSYRDPETGLCVLTRATHLQRGACCESGCRHCPFVET